MKDQRLYSFFSSQIQEKHFVTTNSDEALKEIMKRLRKSECAIVVICAEIFRNLTPLYDEWKKKLYQEKVIKEAKVQSISMLPILSNPKGSDPSLLHIDKMLAQEDSIVVLKGLHQMHYNTRESAYFFRKLKKQTENMTFLSPLVLSTTDTGLFRLMQADASYQSNTIWLILDEKYQSYVSEDMALSVAERPVSPIQKAYRNLSATVTEEQKTTNPQSDDEPQEHTQKNKQCLTESELILPLEGQQAETVTERELYRIGEVKTDAAKEKKSPVSEQENDDQTKRVPESEEQVSRIKQEILLLLGCEKKTDLFQNDLFSNENNTPWYCTDEELFDREMEGLDYIEKKFGVLVHPHIEGKYRRLVCSLKMEANGQNVLLSVVYEPHCVNDSHRAAFFVDDCKSFRKLFRKVGVQPLNDKEMQDLFAFDEAKILDYYRRTGHLSMAAAIIEMFIDTFCQREN